MLTWEKNCQFLQLSLSSSEDVIHSTKSHGTHFENSIDGFDRSEVVRVRVIAGVISFQILRIVVRRIALARPVCGRTIGGSVVSNTIVRSYGRLGDIGVAVSRSQQGCFLRDLFYRFLFRFLVGFHLSLLLLSQRIANELCLLVHFPGLFQHSEWIWLPKYCNFGNADICLHVYNTCKKTLHFNLSLPHQLYVTADFLPAFKRFFPDLDHLCAQMCRLTMDFEYFFLHFLRTFCTAHVHLQLKLLQPRYRSAQAHILKRHMKAIILSHVDRHFHRNPGKCAAVNKRCI